MRKATQEEIRQAREAFQRDGSMPAIPLQLKVLESWIRSRNAGVTLEHADKTLIGPEALQARIEARKAFYDMASSVLDGIYRFTTGSGFISTIFDEEGYVLRVTGDQEIMEMAKANALTEGCNRSEQNLGTNGIGTALVNGTAIQISGEEHYFPLHYNWTCSGAPVFDSNGNTVGGICIIGPLEKVTFHTLGMVSAAAKATTQQLLMQDAYDELNRAQQGLYTITSALTSGVILVDRNLCILEVNRAAAMMLGSQTEQMKDRSIHQFIPATLLDYRSITEGISDRSISLEVDDKPVRLSLSVESTEAGDYVLFFEKLEALHKRVNRIIGSEARFTLPDIIGKSRKMMSAIGLAKLATENSSNVFLKGESGTGKEMFAQAIHNASERRNEPFVAINCGAIPKSLIESELFGYEGGSFTGAKREGCPGKFELANGGTIFLDEIGDMPFDVQVSLLRVLQTREISRIGSSKTIKVDVRVISATHQDVKKAVADNRFRGDLYYRLNVFDIPIPSLRERKEDIPLLAKHFLDKYIGNAHKENLEFSPQALAAMEQYPWPGNVRELENVVERAVYIAKQGLIQPQDLSFVEQKEAEAPAIAQFLYENELPAETSPAFPFRYENERTRIKNALYSTGFSVKKAAEQLGMSRRTLYRRMEHYGFSKEEYQK